MSNGRFLWGRAAFLGALTGASLALTGTAQAEQGVSADSIELGATNAATGAIAVACGPEAIGAHAYLELVNAQGGVNGRKLVYRILDDAYSAQRAVGNVRRLLEDTFAIFTGCGTATAAAALSVLEPTDVPYLFPYAGLDALVVPPKPNVFSLLPRYATQLETILPHVLKQAEPKTAALFSFNIAGNELVRAAARDALEAAGVEVLADELMEVTSPDRAAFALKAIDLKPEVIVLNDSSPGAARFVLELERQGWMPKAITGVSTLADESFIRAVGAAVDGVVIAPGIVAPPSAAESSECVEALANFDSSVTPNHYSMFGCLAAKVLVEAVRRIDGEPTRAKLIASLEGMQDVETQISGPISFADGERMGLSAIFVATIKDGEVVVGDYLPIPR